MASVAQQGTMSPHQPHPQQQQQQQQQRSQTKSIGHYVLGKTIGEGTFGKVKLGRHILSGERVAVKILEKERIVEVADVERIAREVHILKLIRHPHIVQLYEIIETRGQLYLIMEYACGGELFDYIVANGRVQEPEAARFFHQIIAGVDKVHAMHVVHRDLKPENLLLDSHKCIKIVDFGLSNVFREGQRLQTACGSPCYAPPEMVAGLSYVPAMCDLWSCGVILFALVCGYLPFEDQNTPALYKKILEADYTVPRFISDSVKDLIAGLLTAEPSQRFTVANVRAHPWYRQIPESSVSPRELAPGQLGLDEDVLQELDAYGFPRDYAVRCLELNKHNHLTTTYYLLVEKRRRVLEQLDRFVSAAEDEPVPTSARSPEIEGAGGRPATVIPPSPRHQTPTGHEVQSQQNGASVAISCPSPTPPNSVGVGTRVAVGSQQAVVTTPRQGYPIHGSPQRTQNGARSARGSSGATAVPGHGSPPRSGGYPRVAQISPYSAREGQRNVREPRNDQRGATLSARAVRNPETASATATASPREPIGSMVARLTAGIDRRISGGSTPSAKAASNSNVRVQTSTATGAMTPRAPVPKTPGREPHTATPGRIALTPPAASAMCAASASVGSSSSTRQPTTPRETPRERSVSAVSARAPKTPRETPRGNVSRPRESSRLRAAGQGQGQTQVASQGSTEQVPPSPRPTARYCFRQPMSMATPQRGTGPATPLSGRRDNPVSYPASMSPQAGQTTGPYSARTGGSSTRGSSALGARTQCNVWSAVGPSRNGATRMTTR